MSKIIAVTGATGAQGGGVVRGLKATSGWTVRAVTRNPQSEAAKKLADEGIEVVQADFDDEASLEKAFEGASAVFAVTNFWDHFFMGKSRDESGSLEEQQGIRLARAAAKTATLEHYIYSTLPGAAKATGGRIAVPHVDSKANVEDFIKSQLPELAAKTTYLWVGYYPQNMAYYPALKPVEMPGSGQYMQVLPTKADVKILVAGDVGVNLGIWARQVLANGSKVYGKTANVALELWSFRQMLEGWSEVTGRKAVFVECSAETYTELWGEMGLELALQLQFGEEVEDAWKETETHVSAEELGIDAGEVVGFKGAIEKLKALL